jgi:hypothetical protein
MSHLTELAPVTSLTLSSGLQPLEFLIKPVPAFLVSRKCTQSTSTNHITTAGEQHTPQCYWHVIFGRLYSVATYRDYYELCSNTLQYLVLLLGGFRIPADSLFEQLCPSVRM